jgi:hypothetical protein
MTYQKEVDTDCTITFPKFQDSENILFHFTHKDWKGFLWSVELLVNESKELEDGVLSIFLQLFKGENGNYEEVDIEMYKEHEKFGSEMATKIIQTIVNKHDEIMGKESQVETLKDAIELESENLERLKNQ